LNNLQIRFCSFIRENYKTVTNYLRNVLKKQMIIDGSDHKKDKSIEVFGLKKINFFQIQLQFLKSKITVQRLLRALLLPLPFDQVQAQLPLPLPELFESLHQNRQN